MGTRFNDLNPTAITYSRAEKSISIPSPNVMASDVLEQNIQGATIILQQLQDFIFDSSYLASFDPSYARHGDVITYGNHTYNVLEINGRTFKYTTSTRKRMRVFAQMA